MPERGPPHRTGRLLTLAASTWRGDEHGGGGWQANEPEAVEIPVIDERTQSKGVTFPKLHAGRRPSR
jgi:hypothetical protein